jgi:hypothetical protein
MHAKHEARHVLLLVGGDGDGCSRNEQQQKQYKLTPSSDWQLCCRHVPTESVTTHLSLTVRVRARESESADPYDIRTSWLGVRVRPAAKAIHPEFCRSNGEEAVERKQ